MKDVIFLPSDLANQRVEFLEAARHGRAHLRDKDGTGLVMLPERELEALEQYAYWSRAHDRLLNLLRSDTKLTPSTLGDLAWLRAFDREDIAEFAEELHEALVAGLADRDASVVKATVDAWKVTARQLEDPLRRSVLLGSLAASDLEVADQPTHE